MKIVKTIDEIRYIVTSVKSSKKRVGFVPTMGALHQGHLSLMEDARKKCDFVVVSIFVNPTQFGQNEDLDNYPRDLESDAKKCESAGVDIIFAPEVSQMYPRKNNTWVEVEADITKTLCGRSRPSHFRGVSTICTKLFNIVMADIAFFGQKDAQQCAVIQTMVSDLNMPIEIEICPIIRESSGLAMSSRNNYLSPKQRQDAAIIYKSLENCRKMFETGQRNSQILLDEIRKNINSIGYAKIDYAEIVDYKTLSHVETVVNKSLVAVAVEFGPSRLIDNIILDLNKTDSTVK